MRDSLSSSLASLAQAIPQMAMQGQDPSDIVEKIAKTISLRKKGKQIEDAVKAVFEKPEPQVPPTVPQAPQPMGVEQMVSSSMGQQEAPPAEQQPQEQPQAQPAPAAGGQPPSDLAGILSQLGG